MAARNPRILNVNTPLPLLIVAVLGAGTGTALTAVPGTGLEHVVKQIIISNMGAAANVVHIHVSTSTTITSANRIIETSVPADSTTILYVNERINATYMLVGTATVTNEVNVTIIGDVEAA